MIKSILVSMIAVASSLEISELDGNTIVNSTVYNTDALPEVSPKKILSMLNEVGETDIPCELLEQAAFSIKQAFSSAESLPEFDAELLQEQARDMLAQFEPEMVEQVQEAVEHSFESTQIMMRNPVFVAKMNSSIKRVMAKLEIRMEECGVSLEMAPAA